MISIKKINFLLLVMLVLPITLSAQETLSDIQNEVEQTQENYNKKEQELQDKQLEYDQLYEELQTVGEEKTKTENDIKSTKNEIEATNNKIVDLETNKIPSLEEKAYVSLKFSQRNYNENILLAIVYKSVEKGASPLDVAQSSSKIVREVNKYLFELLDTLEELETSKENLKTQSETLTLKKSELKSQENYLTKLKNEVSSKMNEIEGDMKAEQEALAAQKEKERLYKEAGCGPNDVYGVDCAQNEIPASNGAFSRPLAHGVVTNEFGGWSSFYGEGYHTGIDLANSTGTAIYTAAPGKVLYAGPTSDGGGNSVIMLHLSNGQNYVSRYAHMNSITTTTGATVGSGGQIGTVGSTGSATGAHLHFEMQQNSNYDWYSLENPRNYVNFPPLGVWW